MNKWAQKMQILADFLYACFYNDCIPLLGGLRQGR
jgi:hypothetical protein